MKIITGKHIEKYIIILIPCFAIFSIFILEFSLVYLSFSFLIRSYIEKDYSYFKNKFTYFFFIFYLYLLSRYFLKDYVYNENISIIFYFRYGLYVLAIYYFLNKIKDLDKKFLNFLILIFITLSIDTFFQYFLGFNLAGIEPAYKDRMSSFFGDESILGSYLIKFMPFIYIFLITKKMNNSNFLKIFLVILISSLAIFLSGERAAIFSLILLSFYFLIFLKKYQIKQLIILLTFLILSSTLITYDKNIFNRLIKKTYSELTDEKNEGGHITLEKSKTKFNFYIFSSTHNNYYLTAINMFKENKLFGTGPRSFRYICDYKKFQINKNSCSTHPHNYYLEVLSELGLVGFIFLIFGYIYIIFKVITLYFIKEFSRENNYKICIMGLYLINFWPIMPTGSFFNNWTSIILYIPISFYLFINNKQKLT